jgi:hypothetical protein
MTWVNLHFAARFIRMNDESKINFPNVVNTRSNKFMSHTPFAIALFWLSLFIPHEPLLQQPHGTPSFSDPIFVIASEITGLGEPSVTLKPKKTFQISRCRALRM